MCSPASVQFAALGNCAEGIALAFTETIKRQSSSDGVLEVFFVLSFECLGLRMGRVESLLKKFDRLTYILESDRLIYIH